MERVKGIEPRDYYQCGFMGNPADCPKNARNGDIPRPVGQKEQLSDHDQLGSGHNASAALSNTYRKIGSVERAQAPRDRKPIYLHERYFTAEAIVIPGNISIACGRFAIFPVPTVSDSESGFDSGGRCKTGVTI